MGKTSKKAKKRPQKAPMKKKILEAEVAIEERIEEQIGEQMEGKMPGLRSRIKRPPIKALVLVLIVGTVLYLYLFGPLKSYLTEEAIGGFVHQFGIFAPIAFMIIYVGALLVFLPATVFSALGGLLFGTFLGTIYVIIAATIAAALGFLVTRKLSADSKHQPKNKLVLKLVEKCEQYCEHNGLQAFIILRLLYMPYMPLSYAAGLVKSARFRDFTLATFLTNIPGGFTFAYLGSQLNKGFTALILPVVLIGLTLLIPKIVKKFKKDVPA